MYVLSKRWKRAGNRVMGFNELREYMDWIRSIMTVDMRMELFVRVTCTSKVGDVAFLKHQQSKGEKVGDLHQVLRPEIDRTLIIRHEWHSLDSSIPDLIDS